MKKMIKSSVSILIADNDKDFLETRTEFLRKEGYHAIMVSSPSEARRIFDQERVDVAVIDVRLVNDDDEKDTSGIELAKELSRFVPVLLLTGYPSLEYARQTLKPQLGGLPIAYDFIIKQEGPEAMLTAVRNAVTLYTMSTDKRHGRDTLISLWEKDIASVQNEAIWANRVRLVMMTIGAIVILIGAIIVLMGQVSTGVESAIAGVITEGLGVLFSKFVEDANKRRDRYHKELLQLYEKSLAQGEEKKEGRVRPNG